MQPALYFYFEANLIVRSVIKHCAIFMVDLFSDFSCHAGFFFSCLVFSTFSFLCHLENMLCFTLLGLLFCWLFFPPMAKKVCFLHGSLLVVPFHIDKSSTKTLKLKEYWFNGKNKTLCISRWQINVVLLSPTHFLVLLIYLEFDTDYCQDYFI